MEKNHAYDFFYKSVNITTLLFYLSIQTTDVNLFGDSWTTGYNECLPPPVITDPCDDDSEEYQEAEHLCYILMDTHGECFSQAYNIGGFENIKIGNWVIQGF